MTTTNILLLVFGSAILFTQLLIIKKQKKIMDQNETLLAIANQLQESNSKIAADLQTIIADIGDSVPAATVAALQAAADGLKSSADAIDAAINPPTQG